MEQVRMELGDKGHGAFLIEEGSRQIGEMVIAIADNDLTVYHTEVLPEAEGKGMAKQLLTSMVEYARKHQLQVIPLCPYVSLQFKRHPELYADIWKKDKKPD